MESSKSYEREILNKYSSNNEFTWYKVPTRLSQMLHDYPNKEYSNNIYNLYPQLDSDLNLDDFENEGKNNNFTDGLCIPYASTDISGNQSEPPTNSPPAETSSTTTPPNLPDKTNIPSNPPSGEPGSKRDRDNTTDSDTNRPAKLPKTTQATVATSQRSAKRPVSPSRTASQSQVIYN